MITLLKNKFKNISFKMRLKFSDQYGKAAIFSKYLGVKFGRNVRITGTVNFGTESFLIEIGDNVTLTQDIRFHTHDGGVGLFRRDYPGINIMGRIKIGSNVFVGSDTIIMPNVSIGNNVVIGAGSVVTKNVPDNVVVAGNPAKIIKTIDEYKEKSLKNGIYIYEQNAVKRRREIESKVSHGAGI